MQAHSLKQLGLNKDQTQINKNGPANIQIRPKSSNVVPKGNLEISSFDAKDDKSSKTIIKTPQRDLPSDPQSKLAANLTQHSSHDRLASNGLSSFNPSKPLLFTGSAHPDVLNRSSDSLHSLSLQQQPHALRTTTLNLGSTSTLMSGIVPLLMNDHYHQPPHNNPSTIVLHQEPLKRQIDGLIKGKKLDVNNLVVVKELKDQEDSEAMIIVNRSRERKVAVKTSDNQRKKSKGSKRTKSSRDIKDTESQAVQQKNIMNKTALNEGNRDETGKANQKLNNRNQAKGNEQNRQQSKSRSRERMTHIRDVPIQKIVKSLQQALPKTNIQNYFQVRDRPQTHLVTDETPDKLAQGRSNTSQALGVDLVNPKMTQNGRTLSQHNLVNDLSNHSPSIVSHQMNNGRPPSAGIDQLIKDNLKKIKSKNQHEKQQRQISEERMKKQKLIQDQINNIVRISNKEKTYKKIVQIGNNRDGESEYPGCNPKILMPQSKIITASNQQDIRFKNLSFQKLSQSQKIDIAKIKESTKINRAAINEQKQKHRKSYGLEFLEIKKEIQEELKTIQQKENLINKLQERYDQTINISDTQIEYPNRVPKKLNIKKSKKSDPDHLQVNQTVATGNSLLDISIGNPNILFNNNNRTHREEEQNFLLNDSVIDTKPKVLVIKKSKIRKFIKMKQKEKQKEQIEQQINEMQKAIKMQENINRLNEFCKKKLQKQVHKKRNATIQNQQNSKNTIGEGERILINQSKISGRKHNIHDRKHGKKYEEHDSEQEDESSRLSTEFYEEYYRLLNSLKKDDHFQVHENDESRTVHGPISRMNIMKSPTSKSLMHPNQNQLTLIMDSSLEVPDLDRSHLQPIIPKISKSHLANHPLRVKNIKKQALPPRHDKQQKISKSKERAESAPLYKIAQKNLKIKRRAVPKQTLRKPSIDDKYIDTSNVVSINIENQDQQQMINMTETEIELLQLFINKQASKIQRAFRNYLQKKVVAQKPISKASSQSFKKLESQVVSSYINTNSQDQDTIRQLINEEDLIDEPQYDETVRREEEPQIRNEQEFVDYAQAMVVATDDEQNTIYGEEAEYDEEEENDEIDPNIIIITNQQLFDDEKKIVYLSNINSCSLPQTPQQDESLNQNQVVDMSKNSSSGTDNHAQYILEQVNRKANYQSSPSSIYDFDQHNLDALSSQMVESNNNVNNAESVIRLNKVEESNPNFKDYQSQNDSEEKLKDYGMRMFAGSESLLRELKMSTPRELKNSNLKIMSDTQHSMAEQHRTLTQQNSTSSLIYVPQQVQQPEDLPFQHSTFQNQFTNTSQSSQSLFERNSFQQFTQQKLHSLMQNNEFLNLISMREKALDYRKEKERKYIKKMFKSRQFSPRTYTQKKEQLEKWVRLETEEIQKSKKQLQEEWEKTVLMIEETQKNVEIMRETIRSKSHGDHQNKLTSSRNSTSSYATTSIRNEKKSKFEQEEYQPLSHRSNRSIKKINTVNEYQIKKSENEGKIIEQQEKAGQNNANLIDFLEDNWKKTQQNTDQPIFGNVYNKSGGIFIEDQNKNGILSPVPKSDHQPFSYDDTDQDHESEHLHEGNQSLNMKDLLTAYDIPKINQDTDALLNEEERPLIRSRSEQDLSELIKKSKPGNNDYSDCAPPSVQEEDSFRIFDTEMQNQTSQINFGKKNDDIKIQENYFEDSSYKEVVNDPYSQRIIDQELPSHDSLLNESELNKYFNKEANLKFSIEDFKQLDKTKLLQQQESDQELSEMNDIAPEDIELQAKTPEQLSQREESIEHTEPQVDFQQNFGLIPVQTPSNFLFQNAKPGENIKISDILKKNHSPYQVLSTEPDSQQNQQQSFQSSIFDNATLPTEEGKTIDQERQQLANDIAEEILQQLIQQEVKIPATSRGIEEPTQAKIDSPKLKNNVIQVQPVPQQNNNEDVYVIDTTYNEKESRRELIESRQRMNIEQDLGRIEDYINEVINMLQKHELNYLESVSNGDVPQLEQNYHRQFLSVLTMPIKRSQIDVLNQLQTSEIGSYEHFETTMDISSHPILPVDLYLDIERQREESHLQFLYSHSLDHNLENSVMQESVHIHNKGIFDALNESLMKFRPYGIQGEPMPWSNKVRRLQTKVDANQVDTERLFFMVKQDVLRWAQNSVGCIPSQVFIVRRQIENPAPPFFGGDIKLPQRPQIVDQFDDELFQETRERRLAQMLASEVVETEHQWLNYEFEEAQVKIDLSDMILEHLVEEVVQFMNQKV